MEAKIPQVPVQPFAAQDCKGSGAVTSTDGSRRQDTQHGWEMAFANGHAHSSRPTSFSLGWRKSQLPLSNSAQYSQSRRVLLHEVAAGQEHLAQV